MDEIAKQFLQDALLEQLPIGVILTDPNGEMVFVNSAAERIRKVQRDALIGRNVLQCHRQSSRDNVSRALDNILKKPKNVYRRMVEDQKNEQYYLNTYAGIADAQGNALVWRC
ncbi:MAG: PAS domain-containing protein [Candidatus Limiplasma sp.]|nr:PAS domain-containing protein [Candidatus Limiplasma sp.]